MLRKGLDAVWHPDEAPVDGYCATRRGLSSFPPQLLPEKVLPSDTEAVVVKPMPGAWLYNVGHAIAFPYII